MPGALDGIRILDLTAIISGPLATQILADQGADVIKIEPPTIGDLTRPMGTQRGGLSAIFAAVNRSKRSMVLDLAQEEGLEVLRRLVPTADVLVQNFRPGAAERMGIGYTTLQELNPDLVYCSIAGFGRSGPYSGRRVYDPLIQAASGLAWAQGQAPARRLAQDDPQAEAEPELVRSIVCDKVTGLTAAQAITAALFARERGQGGQHVELSMLDAALAFHWSDMMWNHSFLPNEAMPNQGKGGAAAADDVTRTADLADMFRISQAKDGWVVVVSGSDPEFQGICRAFSREDIRTDPRFATLLDRMQNIDALRDWQEEEIGSRTADEVCALLDEHGVPCAKINRIPDLPSDPQIQHNGVLRQVMHPLGGKMLQVEPPVHFEKTPAAVSRLAAAHGEHTEEVLREIGLDSASIAELRQAGVLGVPAPSDRTTHD